MGSTTSIELLKKMLETYSPSGKEKELSTLLKDELKKLGFDKVRTDKVENVYGETGSGEPAVLLCGHMDTVPGWIPVKTEDNRLYGRGAVDAKSSLAAMVSAAARLKPEKKNGKVIVAGVVEEERTARGIRQLIRERLKVDCAIFGEPSGIKNITFAYRGRLGLKVTCKTKTGHVGAQHLLDNAIEKSLEFWNRLKATCERYKSPHGVFYSLTPSLIGIISRRTSGGLPDICILNIDLRLPPTLKCEDGMALVKESLNNFQRMNPEASFVLSGTDRIEPFVAERDSPIMKALSEAIAEITGEPVKFLRKTGTGDMNIFGNLTGIPVVTYGPGDAHLGHTSNEYVEISEYLSSIQVYERMLEKVFS